MAISENNSFFPGHFLKKTAIRPDSWCPSLGMMICMLRSRQWISQCASYQPQFWIYTRVHWMHGDVPGSQFVSTINSESLEQAKEITYDGVPAYFLQVFPSVLKNFIGCSGANMVWSVCLLLNDPEHVVGSLKALLHLTFSSFRSPYNSWMVYWVHSDQMAITSELEELLFALMLVVYMLALESFILPPLPSSTYDEPVPREVMWNYSKPLWSNALWYIHFVKSDSTPSNKYVTTIVIEHFCLVCTEFSVIK